MTEDDRYVAVTTTWREAKDALEKRLIETQDPNESNRYDDGLRSSW